MGAENTKDIPDDIHLLQCMREMTFYLPALEDPNFAPGEFSPPQKTKSGSIIMPYVIFGDVAEVFIATAYDSGWVLRGFDWASWPVRAKLKRCAAIRPHSHERSRCNSCAWSQR